MKESIRLGRIGGIPVGVNWTLLVIFALVAIALASGRFPEVYPGHASWAYALAGIGTAAAFFGSILAHELAHALLARRKGVEVEGIILWLFGGVARFHSEATRAQDELRIAAVGPLISVVAGALFGLLALGIDALGAADLLVGVFGWLALINLVLAGFNLIPAAPLDGGRVLRALLWRRSGDRRQAAITAARAGQGFAALLIGLGIAEFAFGAGLGGIWFMLLGWFVLTAARAEQTYARVQGIRVTDVMTPDPVVAPDWLTVQDFLDQYVFPHRFSTFPVQGFDGQLTGVVTLRALKRVPPQERATAQVRAVRCPMERVPTVRADDDLTALFQRSAGACTEGRVLVLGEDGKAVGIVSPADIARVLDLTDLSGARREPHVS